MAFKPDSRVTYSRLHMPNWHPRDSMRQVFPSNAIAAEFFGVSIRTIERWKKFGYTIPNWALRLIQIHCEGALPCPAWENWRILEGELISPYGHPVTPEFLLGLLAACNVEPNPRLAEWLKNRPIAIGQDGYPKPPEIKRFSVPSMTRRTKVIELPDDD